ncbi:type IV pili methyl-accepting chemotaxis transducer N-terminal domain-containing protein [Cyclobacterium qasimii]|uniref:Multi-sensor signal transduction histidine kinase n=1 Tax=Cyclobacterium qasimii M12-11B TaxID=641524 RepID=S7V7L4_9BACT|nr:type IV pili methyl-accepting chemotaxis transducer N-terminal domain-containing protein [Cyclobacterium qasimii]EPR65582.1 multi-sensor signal transduction histidine kinase [Cyclobacterium qasimii M12-11B]
MESQLLSKKPKFNKLGKYYLVALCAIALSIILSQILIQKFISEQENDSRVINLSGRQRMLSQKISKCVLLLADTSYTSKDKSTLKELDGALEEWKEVHHLLQWGNNSLGEETQNSKRITALFSSIKQDYEIIVNATEEIVRLLKNDINTPKSKILKGTEIVISQEASFLKKMDQIVYQFDNEAKTRVMNLKNIEAFFLALSLGVILFEIFLFYSICQNHQKDI